MNTITTKLYVLAIVSLILSATGMAQNNADEQAVRTCLENYMSGDGNKVEKAFHPSATMKYIDAQNGEFKDIPITDYISQVKANPAKQDRKIEIVTLNIEGNAASGKIKIETDKAILYDYMNMLKVDGEWKIVSKVFSRTNK